jgi:NADPH-dependent curcumin reductase CurA
LVYGSLANEKLRRSYAMLCTFKTKQVSAVKNKRVVLASRPQGEPTASNFRIEEVEVPEIAEGEVLLRTLYLSLDPYMRGRMSDAKSYAEPVKIGEVMEGATVAQVVSSKNPSFKQGDVVLSYSGWQQYAAASTGLRKLDPSIAPVSTALGVLGMPGLTAYAGLLTIGQPKAGETVCVAAATGPVGSMVGQIAKIMGCRTVGIAGGANKCRSLIDEFGFDAAIDHRSPDFASALSAACPKGIDVYFENVGGAVWDAVMPLLNDFARIPVCGLIAHYNSLEGTGRDRTPELMMKILRQRLTLRGFIVSDFAEQAPKFYRDVIDWLKQDRIKYREDIIEGLDAAPEAFMGLLQGKNFGKLIVQVASIS